MVVINALSYPTFSYYTLPPFFVFLVIFYPIALCLFFLSCSVLNFVTPIFCLFCTVFGFYHTFFWIFLCSISFNYMSITYSSTHLFLDFSHFSTFFLPFSSFSTFSFIFLLFLPTIYIMYSCTFYVALIEGC
jgi:hypothetical protein